MMSLEELRKNFPAKKPSSVLAQLLKMTERPPILTVTLTSGQAFRGYVVNGAGNEDDGSFVFQLEVQNEGDGAADLCYVKISAIAAVTVWNVDDYPGALNK